MRKELDGEKRKKYLEIVLNRLYKYSPHDLIECLYNIKSLGSSSAGMYLDQSETLDHLFDVLKFGTFLQSFDWEDRQHIRQILQKLGDSELEIARLTNKTVQEVLIVLWTKLDSCR